MTRLEEEYLRRKNKINEALKQGINPYPASTRRLYTIREALDSFENLKQKSKSIILVGRIRTMRLHGGSCFLHIEDGSEKVQIYLKKDELTEKIYNQFKSIYDIGDFIEVEGIFFITKKGERTLQGKKINLLSKSLLPLPEKWHGLSDIEIRYRKRFLDLISNSEVKKIFKKRSLIVQSIRNFLNKEGFLDVDTPILQPIPGGANARPFKTHHNALNIDLYLRIAPELYLKQLIIGGFEKVYEIAKCFRNEGIDKNHNPEFTQVEFYAAYWDYNQMMDFTEKLIENVVTSLNHNTIIKYEGELINCKPPFKRITFKKACEKYAKINIEHNNENEIIEKAKKQGVEIKKNYNKAKVLDEVFKEFVLPNLIKPTFVTDYPVELSPLAKKKAKNPKYVERFQLIIANKELCNAFSELNNPIEQEQRFLDQEKMRAAGDKEAQRIDKNYLEALSYGMPPTSGNGIGIERLVALLTDAHNIKEVILFPTLKPKKGNG